MCGADRSAASAELLIYVTMTTCPLYISIEARRRAKRKTLRLTIFSPCSILVSSRRRYDEHFHSKTYPAVDVYDNTTTQGGRKHTVNRSINITIVSIHRLTNHAIQLEFQISINVVKKNSSFALRNRNASKKKRR